MQSTLKSRSIMRIDLFAISYSGIEKQPSCSRGVIMIKGNAITLHKSVRSRPTLALPVVTSHASSIHMPFNISPSFEMRKTNNFRASCLSQLPGCRDPDEETNIGTKFLIGSQISLTSTNLANQMNDYPEDQL